MCRGSVHHAGPGWRAARRQVASTGSRPPPAWGSRSVVPWEKARLRQRPRVDERSPASWPLPVTPCERVRSVGRPPDRGAVQRCRPKPGRTGPPALWPSLQGTAAALDRQRSSLHLNDTVDSLRVDLRANRHPLHRACAVFLAVPRALPDYPEILLERARHVATHAAANNTTSPILPVMLPALIHDPTKQTQCSILRLIVGRPQSTPTRFLRIFLVRSLPYGTKKNPVNFRMMPCSKQDLGFENALYPT